jgi:WD40 repeat protein/energy-coupling factor transporter ATP-binding protein EcfA2
MAPEYTKDEKFIPFPGLRPFKPGENEYFFGREHESREITGKLLDNRFVAVIGASGSGKSSLIQCGLLPELRQLSSRNNYFWTILSITPGNDPFRNLSDAIIESGLNTGQKKLEKDEILKSLQEDKDGLTKLLGSFALRPDNKVLLVIDQFEELFRYGSPEAGVGTVKGSSEFIDLIANAINLDNPGFYTVIALRSDLISECARFKNFTALINNCNFLVPRMTEESIKDAIEGPLIKAGVKIDNDLLRQLAAECNTRADQLPILQHTMMCLWTRWKELDEPDRSLDFSDYASAGDMEDAISRDADEVYLKLSPDSRKICEKLFKIITGKGSDNKGIRYPSNVKTIWSAIRCKREELTEVIDKFRDPSLSVLTPDYKVTLSDDTLIDLSHESLIHLWDRLRKWVDEEAASVEMYLNLSELSAMYQQGKAGLLKQPDLQLAINWRDQNKPTLYWAQKYNPAFERAMVYLRTSEKEFREAEERKSRQNRWKLKRIRIISSVLGMFVVVTAMALAGTWISKVTSDNRRRAAEKQKNEIIVQKEATEKFATLAIQKSVESDSVAAAATRREKEERHLRELAENQSRINALDSRKISYMADINTKAAEEKSIETQRLRMISIARSMSLRSLQMQDQADLQALLAYQAYLFNKKYKGSANDADIYSGLYTLAKLKGNPNFRTFTGGHDGQIRSIAFMPGKKVFFTSGSDGKVLKWDMESKEQSYQVIYSNSEIIDVLAVSPKSDWLACGEENSAIRMVPLNGGDSGYELRGHSGKIRSLIFSFDGKYLYSAALDGKVLKWDLTAKTSTQIGTENMAITSIDISINGKYFAGINTEGKSMVWDPANNFKKLSIGSEGKTIKTIRFNPDGQRIAVGYDDGMIELWDIAERKKISEFRAHSGYVSEIRFNSDLVQMATSGYDGTLKLWDLNDMSAAPVSFNDNGGPLIAFEFSPDGQVILSGCIEGTPGLLSRPAYADTFAADGCKYVTRNFRPDEWVAYVGKDIPYDSTCLGADMKIRIREIK